MRHLRRWPVAVAAAVAWLPARALAQTAPAPPPPVTPEAPAAPAAPLAATPAPAPAAPAAAAHAGSRALDLATLEHLRETGILSQAEYELALREVGASTGDRRAAESLNLVLGKWITTVYGFLEGDAIYDTTQSFGDLAGNAQVLRPSGSTAPPASALSGLPSGTVQPVQPTQGYGGSHGQTQFSARNSRFGVRLRTPGTDTVHVSGMLEMDFLGNQPPGITQTSTFTSPTMRLRHAMFRVETPVVDFLVGQYWHLFGWQEAYLPNTTEIQGVPGELYARAPQVRISKTLHTSATTLELAIAAVRPPAQSEVPEGEGGVRFSLDKWTGMHTAGATGTALTPASISVTGDFRYFEVPETATPQPTSMVNTTAGSVAGDLYLPILPASEDRRGNALSVMAQAVYGNGIADQYAAMQSGVMYPFVPIPNALSGTTLVWPVPTDQGLVDYDITPGQFFLHPVQWTTLLVGLEYYLPGLDGKVWISGNYSHVTSSNSGQFARALTDTPSPQEAFFPASAAQVRKGEDWWDANVFFDPVAGVRVGLEFAGFYDHYVDGYTATNYRAQASGFFVF